MKTSGGATGFASAADSAASRGRHARAVAGRPLALAALALATAGCVHVPPQGRASVRWAEYQEMHRELPAPIARAMGSGHVMLGMDPEQIWVVLGTPSRRTRHGGAPPVEVWLYPAHRLHQDALHSHGATLFRLVFSGDRLVLIEPL